MSLDRERRSSAERATRPARSDPQLVRGDVAPGRSLTLAGGAVWLLYAAIYALSFGLSGAPVGVAIRAGFANAIPDGLLALAVLAASRRIDRERPALGQLFRLHLIRGTLFVLAAAAGKTLLLWADVVMLARQPFQISPGVIAWQVFLSALIGVAVAASSHAWLIARRLREEEANAARAEALRARAEMAALRAQLNPHFLFNTLHSVLGLVRRDPALAETAIEKLGDLLHYATRIHRDGVDFAALRQEWAFVETYLDLERIRLADRLQVVRRVDEAALDVRVPTFSLQPLVENAVRHGVAPRAAGGRITIDAHLDRDARTLRLEVHNEGEHREGARTAEPGGLGLRVLRERLDALYHGAAHMVATPGDDGGYTVVLTLPLTVEDDGAGT